MVRVERANYPAEMVDGAYHHDLDPANIYRYPVTVDTDWLCFFSTPEGAAGRWVVQDGDGNVVAVTIDMRRQSPILLRDRRIRELEQQLGGIHITASVPEQTQVPARDQTRARAPDTFSGIPDDKGELEPEPRAFVRQMRKYIDAQELQAPLTENKKMTYAKTYMVGDAAVWLEQLQTEKDDWEMEHEDDVDPAPYEGPLESFEALMEGLLVEFEDIDPEATAQHKLDVIHMGKETAEAHNRRFKTLARHSGYNDKALVGYYRRSLTPGLKKKIQDMADRPTTLDGWYRQAVKFDRQWREDQDERQHARTPATNQGRAGNQSAAPRSNASNPAPRSNNNNWRSPPAFMPWGGSVSRPAPAPGGEQQRAGTHGHRRGVRGARVLQVRQDGPHCALLYDTGRGDQAEVRA